MRDRTDGKGPRRPYSRRNIWRKEDLDDVFVVIVKRREHSTWQGRIEWTNQNQVRYFRSDLELLNLLREALAEGVHERR